VEPITPAVVGGYTPPATTPPLQAAALAPSLEIRPGDLWTEEGFDHDSEAGAFISAHPQQVTGRCCNVRVTSCHSDSLEHVDDFGKSWLSTAGLKVSSVGTARDVSILTVLWQLCELSPSCLAPNALPRRGSWEGEKGDDDFEEQVWSWLLEPESSHCEGSSETA
jgi:hypothetical protein